MLRTNLSTRPFYNERAVRTGLIALAVLALGLTVFNAIEILRLEGQSRQARQSMAQNAAQARDLREKARVIRQSINQVQLAAVQTAANEANTLIDRRAFSWTELLNYIQDTLPADVRLAGVAPQSDESGRLLIAISVLSRRIDDLDEFIDALEQTGAFTNVLARQDSVEEDGTWQSELQGYYHSPAPAVPPASSSEPGSGNTTPRNVTPGIVAAGGPR